MQSLPERRKGTILPSSNLREPILLVALTLGIR
jgi:hypothetical protein